MSVHCRRRLNYHRWELVCGIHRNPHLQSAWNLYGEDNFTFEILEEHAIEFLPSMETYWVNLLNCDNREYGYNITSPSPILSPGVSEETRRKISTIHKGKVVSNETKDKLSTSAIIRMKDNNRRKKLGLMLSGKKRTDKIVNIEPSKFRKITQKPIYQYSLDGDFVREWECLSVAAFETNICRPNICKSLKGIRNSAGGYIWKYADY